MQARAMTPEPPPGWEAELELGFAARGEGTILQHRAHRGPLRVQRPFYPEGPGCCHTYVLHPPGGLVGGDWLRVRARVGAGAAALLTTPAAGKAYRSGGGLARQAQALAADDGASLEWLPQETIVFDGARLALETRVDLAARAAFIGWEIVCLGRPAGGERFARGECRQRLEVWREGSPVVLERLLLEGSGDVQRAPWGLGGQPVTATLIASPAPADGVDQLRALGELLPPEDRAAVTVVEGALVCRYLGASAERARGHLLRAWTLLRPAVIGRPACPPRIWMT
jgi:urease accessory protein